MSVSDVKIFISLGNGQEVSITRREAVELYDLLSNILGYEDEDMEEDSCDEETEDKQPDKEYIYVPMPYPVGTHPYTFIYTNPCPVYPTVTWTSPSTNGEYTVNGGATWIKNPLY